jgi:hypothetical protein
MKKFIPLILVGALLLFSCTSSLERKGDDFLEEAKTAETIAQQHHLEKNAYESYRQALENAGWEDADPELINKFTYATIIRLHNLKESAGITHNIMPPLRNTVEDFVYEDYIEDDVKDYYAEFLVEYADTLYEKGNLTHCFEQLNKAMEIAANKNVVKNRYNELKTEYADQKLSQAQSLYDQATEGDEIDIETLLRADYNVQIVLNIDEDNEAAQELNAKITPKMLDTYRAYQRVYPRPVSSGLDTTMYREINYRKVFMAITDQRKSGSTLDLEGLIFHSEDGYKVLRLRDHLFTLHLENGDTLKPTDSKFSSRTLDVQSQQEFDLTFQNVTSKPKKLVYTCSEGELKSPKYFY